MCALWQQVIFLSFPKAQRSLSWFFQQPLLKNNIVPFVPGGWWGVSGSAYAPLPEVTHLHPGPLSIKKWTASEAIGAEAP